MDYKLHLFLKKLCSYEENLIDNIKRFIIPKYKYEIGQCKIIMLFQTLIPIFIIDREYIYKENKILYSYSYDGRLSEGWIDENGYSFYKN
jgi:hypothetical protein